mmetsp:Transcript_9630/g.31570  ORF Transcript_9630/g.31570 Transcript_9630/m.31570 type:complete len:741 (-) Transcript_9630:375-2597(-)
MLVVFVEWVEEHIVCSPSIVVQVVRHPLTHVGVRPVGVRQHIEFPCDHERRVSRCDFERPRGRPHPARHGVHRVRPVCHHVAVRHHERRELLEHPRRPCTVPAPPRGARARSRRRVEPEPRRLRHARRPLRFEPNLELHPRLRLRTSAATVVRRRCGPHRRRTRTVVAGERKAPHEPHRRGGAVLNPRPLLRHFPAEEVRLRGLALAGSALALERVRELEGEVGAVRREVAEVELAEVLEAGDGRLRQVVVRVAVEHVLREVLFVVGAVHELAERVRGGGEGLRIRVFAASRGERRDRPSDGIEAHLGPRTRGPRPLERRKILQLRPSTLAVQARRDEVHERGALAVVVIELVIDGARKSTSARCTERHAAESQIHALTTPRQLHALNLVRPFLAEVGLPRSLGLESFVGPVPVDASGHSALNVEAPRVLGSFDECEASELTEPRLLRLRRVPVPVVLFEERRRRALNGEKLAELARIRSDAVHPRVANLCLDRREIDLPLRLRLLEPCVVGVERRHLELGVRKVAHGEVVRHHELVQVRLKDRAVVVPAPHVAERLGEVVYDDAIAPRARVDWRHPVLLEVLAAVPVLVDRREQPRPGHRVPPPKGARVGHVRRGAHVVHAHVEPAHAAPREVRDGAAREARHVALAHRALRRHPEALVERVHEPHASLDRGAARKVELGVEREGVPVNVAAEDRRFHQRLGPLVRAFQTESVGALKKEGHQPRLRHPLVIESDAPRSH